MIARPLVALRSVAASDVVVCAALFDRVRRETFPWEAPAASGPAEFVRIFAGEEQTLAWAGTTLTGVVSIFRAESFVHGLYIHPSWQGLGIGALLLAAGLAGTTGAARLKCNIGNVGARRFYERLGWREVARNGSRRGDWILYMHEGPTA